MKVQRWLLAILLLGGIWLGSGGCGSGETQPASPTSQEEVESIDPPLSSTPEPSLTPPPTFTAVPNPSSTPLPYPPPGENGEHFLLTRPIDTFVDFTYRYGSNLDGTRATHHGVEFLAEFGTPIYAAADGKVVAAGEDLSEVYGPYPNFYGQVVVIEHDQLKTESDLYSVYGHLSLVSVEVGQRVSRGEQIGEVGFTGAATGSHLHFEVRLGENDYAHTRNPELWVVPIQEDGQYYGAIAGQLIGSQGFPIPGVPIEIQRLDEEEEVIYQLYTATYADLSVNGDDRWGENFAVSDLEPGIYRVQFVINGLQKYVVEVRPGEVALITYSLGE